MAEAVECAYAMEGNGPPLIMVHGISSRKELWTPVVEGLKDDFTCITYDLRGHGASPITPEHFDLDELVADLEDVRRRVGVEKAHVIGHSLGGMIAPAYARAFPNRVGALGMLATSAFRTPEIHDAIRGMSLRLEKEGMAGLIDGWLGGWFTDDFMAKNPDIVERRKKQALATDPATFRRVFEIFHLNEMGPWLPEVKSPSLVLAAELDIHCNPEINARIAGAMPNAQLAVLAGLKHSILLEAPERVSRAVRDFLLANPF